MRYIIAILIFISTQTYGQGVIVQNTNPKTVVQVKGSYAEDSIHKFGIRDTVKPSWWPVSIPYDGAAHIGLDGRFYWYYGGYYHSTGSSGNVTDTIRVGVTPVVGGTTGNVAFNGGGIYQESNRFRFDQVASVLTIGQSPTPNTGGLSVLGNTTADNFIATNTNDPGFPFGAYQVNRTLDPAVAANAHGFIDNTIFGRTNRSYAGYDFRAKFNAKSLTGHFLAYQALGAYSGTDTLGLFESFAAQPEITLVNGRVTSAYDFQSYDHIGFGSIGERRAVYIRPLTRATRNFGVYSEGKQFNYFGGRTVIGSVSGLDTTASSSIFAVRDSTRGSNPFPRMSSAVRQAIATPFRGLFAYDTTVNHLYHYNGSVWASLVDSVDFTTKFTKGGDSSTTDLSLGTLSPFAMRFLSGGAEAMRLFTNGNLSIGSTTDAGAKLSVTGNIKLTGLLGHGVFAADPTTASGDVWYRSDLTRMRTNVGGTATSILTLLNIPTTANQVPFVNSTGTGLIGSAALTWNPLSSGTLSTTGMMQSTGGYVITTNNYTISNSGGVMSNNVPSTANSWDVRINSVPKLSANNTNVQSAVYIKIGEYSSDPTPFATATNNLWFNTTLGKYRTTTNTTTAVSILQGNDAILNGSTSQTAQFNITGTGRSGAVVSNGSIPTVTFGTGAGASSTPTAFSVTGSSNNSFTLTITPSASPAANATVAVFTFVGVTFPVAPNCIIQAGNKAATEVATTLFPTETTTTVTITTNDNPLTSGVSYDLEFLVL